MLLAESLVNQKDLWLSIAQYAFAARFTLKHPAHRAIGSIGFPIATGRGK